MAERVGFEPTVPVKVLRISSAVQSTTLPPLRTRFAPVVAGRAGGRSVGGDIAAKKAKRKSEKSANPSFFLGAWLDRLAIAT